VAKPEFEKFKMSATSATNTAVMRTDSVASSTAGSGSIKEVYIFTLNCIMLCTEVLCHEQLIEL
jgi:hypothetical protein